MRPDDQIILTLLQRPEAGRLGAYPECWYYPASANAKGKALILAGIHGNEYSAKAMGKALRHLIPGWAIAYDTLLIPSFSPTRSRKGLSAPDLNREFGHGYMSKDPLAGWLTELITRWSPDRVISIHADGIFQNAGIYGDPLRERLSPKGYLKAHAQSGSRRTVLQKASGQRPVYLLTNAEEADHARVVLPNQQNLPLTAWLDRAGYPELQYPAQWKAAYSSHPGNEEFLHLLGAMITASEQTARYCQGNVPTKQRPAQLSPQGHTNDLSVLYPGQGYLRGGISLGEWLSAADTPIVTLEIAGKEPERDFAPLLPAVAVFLG